MRDRLIELIRKQRKLCNDKNCGSCGYAKFGGYPDCQNKMLAHELIENGVIVPPCKVGDKVYVLYPDPRYNWGNKKLKVLELKVYSLRYFDNGMHIEMRGDGKYITWGISSFGVSIFLTKEEAERELEKERVGND